MPSCGKVTILTLIALTTSYTLAAPFPSPNESNQIANTYSSQGGHASGGNVNNSDSGKSFLGGGLIRLFSGNAGNAGKSSSVASPPVTNARVNELKVGANGPSADRGNNVDNSLGNAYTAPGGTSDGGSVNNGGIGLIDLFSGNAGGDGQANSESGKMGIVNVPTPGRQRVTRFIRLKLD